jgi:hypothetical protein
MVVQREGWQITDRAGRSLTPAMLRELVEDAYAHPADYEQIEVTAELVGADRLRFARGPRPAPAGALRLDLLRRPPRRRNPNRSRRVRLLRRRWGTRPG